MNRGGHVLNAVLLAVGLGYLLQPTGDTAMGMAMVEVGVPILLGALFPDVDTAFGRHRKTLHNLPVLAFFVAFPYYFGNLQYVWIGVLTHYVLDYLGTRRGLALLYPYEREFSVPIGVAVNSRFATPVTVGVTAVELAIAAVVLPGTPPPFEGLAGLDGNGTMQALRSGVPPAIDALAWLVGGTLDVVAGMLSALG